MKKAIILISMVVVILSCDNMNDIHQKYLDEGEEVYLGKTDSVIAFDGVGRVKLVWYANGDPKIETTMIYWNLRQDSVEHTFSRVQHGVQKDSVIISDLPEGTYFFELVNKNSHGERSLPVSVQGISYGDTYASDLRVRPVAGITCIGFDPVTQSSTVKIVWDLAPLGCINTKVTYKKRSNGEEVSLDVNETATETTLTDVGNRLEHPDDVLYVSSVYAPEGCIDMIESAKQKEQLVLYTASGTRTDHAVYDVFTFTYANQEKSFRLVNTTQGLTLDCNRVAELNPAAFGGSSFRLTVRDDYSISVKGIYAAFNPITDMEPLSSVYNPDTQSFTLRYQVATSGGGIFTIEETLVPKTTPFEKQVAKPYGDMRARVPGDKNSTLVDNEAGYGFQSIWDNVIYPNVNPGRGDHGWIGYRDNLMAFTIDLKETINLTRMILWPGYSIAQSASEIVYGYFNVYKFEIWGTADWDETKETEAAYWVDAVDPTGTFKADWVHLGVYEIERLDRKGASNQEILNRARDGNHFTLPASAGPIRYFRFICREYHNATPGAYMIGELEFFGHSQ